MEPRTAMKKFYFIHFVVKSLKLEFSQVHKMRNSSIDIKWLFESDFLSLSKRIKCTKQNLFICVWWFQILLWILKFSIIVCLFTYLFVPHVFLTHATSPNSCYLTAARRPRGRFFSSGSGPRGSGWWNGDRDKHWVQLLFISGSSSLGALFFSYWIWARGQRLVEWD